MPWVWVSIGSNLDRERCIRGAVAALRGRFGDLRLSRVFESEAVGFEGQPFYNLVAGFRTEADIPSLQAIFRALEDTFGRVRQGSKFSPRTLDLDLLTYGDDLVRGDEILGYAFVLGPLAELAGEERHPELGLTYRELWVGFDQASQPLRPVDLNLD